MRTTSHTGALLCAVFIAPTFPLFGQGSLTPPAGTPAPLFKTLQQIEPRTDLQAVPAPSGVVTTDSNFHFIINQPGSYYLSANLGVTKLNGIQINAEGVTLDVNGFQISRTSGSGGNGIQIQSSGDRSTIRNGSVKGFAIGVASVLGVKASSFHGLAVSGCTDTALQTGDGATVNSCRVHDNTGTIGIQSGLGSSLTHCTATTNNLSGTAIIVGNDSSITNCAVTGNTAANGISLSIGSTMTNCAASQNTVEWGISASAGCIVSECSADFNTSTDSGATGGIFVLGDGSTIVRCTARQNTNATATNGHGVGIRIVSQALVEGCVATTNQGDGIQLGSNCVVRGNLAHGNGASGDGAGIHATGTDNLIDGNKVTGNDRGVDVDGESNIIVRNTAAGNTTAFAIAANNRFGPILNITGSGVAAQNINNASGNVSSVMASTDPWANFLH